MIWTRATLVEQVLSVCSVTDDGCWLWRYGVWKARQPVDDRMYPRLMIGGRRALVGDWILESVHGHERPQGLELCHKCDRPPCCSPAHLRWDTHSANMAEMSDRGRAGAVNHPERVPRGDTHWSRRTPERIYRGPKSGDYAAGSAHWTRQPDASISWRGEAHHQARLNADLVRQIRDMAIVGMTATQIMKVVPVGRGTIRAVIERRTWKHVE